MIAVAQRRVPDNVNCVLGDLAHLPLPAGGYDAITTISTLHPVELAEVLPRLTDALRPGGVPAAISLHRTQLPWEPVPTELSVLADHGRRAALLCHPAVRRSRLALVETGTPVKEPELTLPEVRQQVRGALPRARVRRLWLWRHEMVRRKPAAPT